MSRSTELAKPIQEGQQEKMRKPEEVALRAYELWQQKGCPQGSAEEDWLQAEEELEMAR
jgi:hypothetical protein